MEQLIRLAALAIGTWWLLDNRSKKMPAVQACFGRFHDVIRLGEEDEKAKLREKREIILDTLRLNLGESVPQFESFHQGSYAMHTGTVPFSGEFDIDIGLIFDCSRQTWNDPVKLKLAVRDALNRNARTVSVRRSCVTVHYAGGKESAYHVDLAIYVKRPDGLLDIAKGKEHSKSENRYWEKSDPRGLTALLSKRFAKENLSQYRRCIRYVKRWRDVQFSSGGPLSIALTVAAYRWFEPHEPLGGNSFDLVAMRDWTKALLSRFEHVKTSEGYHQRLRVLLPIEPKSDLMGKMTKSQMSTFHDALRMLHKALVKAYDESAPDECLRLLGEQFGADFPLRYVPVSQESVKTDFF